MWDSPAVLDPSAWALTLDVRDVGGGRPGRETELSEEALTAAVMPRYHLHQAVKRTLGASLRSVEQSACLAEHGDACVFDVRWAEEG